MKVRWDDHRSGTVLTLEGELVSEDTDVLRRRCEDRIDGDARWIVDLRSLDRIDSAGIETLLWLSELVQRSSGQLRFVRGEGQPGADRRLAMHN